ncbi:capsid vertex protein [Vibrio phage vB_VmeM-32]|nr:capsid vertex protein [Vibrio phage vB_VmeM-32]
MSKIINKLLTESQSVAIARPTLAAITQKIASEIHTELVSIVYTKRPNAMVMGLRMQSENGTEINTAPFSNISGRTSENETVDFPATFQIGEYFNLYGIDFQAIDETVFSIKPSIDKLYELAYSGTIRIANDAYTNEEKDYTPSSFILDGWKANVATRKIGTGVSHELIQDLNSMNLDSDNIIENMLVTSIAHEINRDIISKLICVSTKSGSIGVNSFLKESDMQDIIIRRIHEESGHIEKQSSFKPNWVLCSPGVAGVIKNSSNYSGGLLAQELEIVVDAMSPVDYFMVGVKDEINNESVAPIYYTPMRDEERDIFEFTFLEMMDTKNMQPIYGCMSRYALSANPYIDSTLSRQLESGDDWTKSANKSPFCRMVVVKLPTTK